MSRSRGDTGGSAGPGGVGDRSVEGDDLPVGEALPDWEPRVWPARAVMAGRYCRLEPLDAGRHADALAEANALDESGVGWTYLPYGPFSGNAKYRHWVERMSAADDPQFYAIVDTGRDGETQHPCGVASYLRIRTEIGSIEVGHIHYSPRLQQTRAGTEAMYLMMRRAFDELGYRRYEWKCDALNGHSRRAAERLGFTYEGTFRCDTMYKGRNRDTAWYSIIHTEWSRLRHSLEAWLEPANFDEGGAQLMRLQSLREGASER